MSRLFLISDAAARRTVELLREAATQRGLQTIEIDSRTFDPDTAERPVPGDLLYRPSAALSTLRVEQLLAIEGVATFFRSLDRVRFRPPAQDILLQQAGIPMPRTVLTLPDTREGLAAAVERLGGFPVILRAPGGEGGVGIMRLDSLPSLASVADYVKSTRASPILTEFVPDASSWRVIVLGGSAIASYRSIPAPGDFRSNVRGASIEIGDDAPEPVARIAVAAAGALGLEFGGADILVSETRPPLLTELNFPCYFPQAQDHAGVDIAGLMLDHLLAKRP